jgi:ATP-dependent Lon protease
MQKSINSSVIVPIFPLPIVLFPSIELPLHIFEKRYRAMIDDVVQADGAFGVIRIEEGASSIAVTGCLARIVDVTRLHDGRMNILACGYQRFSVLELLDGRPYRQARVRALSESEPGVESYAVAREVRAALDDIARLSSKLQGHPTDVLDDRPSDPTALSYWIPARLYGSPSEQQRLLDMNTVLERLDAEYILLNETRNQLAAKTALKDAFS